LLGEYTQTGHPIQETVYLGDTPVAVLTGRKALYVYADHLNSPRAIADSTNTVVWRWDSDPLGTTLPNEDPDGNGKKITYNLRFPGQYYDRETGLHYNYFRDYDPGTGRYIESDPIGLLGGINSYNYGGNNPVNFSDPHGAFAWVIAIAAAVIITKEIILPLITIIRDLPTITDKPKLPPEYPQLQPCP
jgi:RHS repeat-associated protein